MGRKPIDMVGKTFHQLTVLHRDGSNSESKPMYVCRCTCGRITRTQGNYLRIGKTKSCGCRTTATHHMSKHPLWGVWNAMIQRCSNEKCKMYRWYGKRGIKVCEEWKDSIVFIEWALKTGWQPGLTIDRIDNDLGYFPENCRWLTRSQNTMSQPKMTKYIGKEFFGWRVVKNIFKTLKAHMQCIYCGKEEILNRANVRKGKAKKCTCNGHKTTF